MADKKISDLTAQTAMAATDVMEVATATPASKKITWANLAQAAFDYLTSLTAKTTLVDADQIVLADSAASNVGKKITWANFYEAARASMAVATASAKGLLSAADFTKLATMGPNGAPMASASAVPTSYVVFAVSDVR